MKRDEIRNAGSLGGLLRGDDDSEMRTILEVIDARYAQGPSDERRTQAYLQLKHTLQGEMANEIVYDRLEGTPFGDLLVAVSNKGVIALAFGGDETNFGEELRAEHGVEIHRDPGRVAMVIEQMDEYFQGSRERFEFEYDLQALTPFQRSVLKAVQQVPKGSYVTYRELAERIGKPGAARAVGQALGRNPIPILIPCHRVIATDGSLGGYSGPGGVETKCELLRMEGAIL